MRVVNGLQRSSPFVLLRGRVFLGLEGVAFAGEGNGVAGVVLLGSFHCYSKIV